MNEKTDPQKHDETVPQETRTEVKPCPFCGNELLPHRGVIPALFHCKSFQKGGEIPCTGNFLVMGIREWNSAYCWQELSKRDAEIKNLLRDRKELIQALEQVEYKQTEVISMLRKTGFVFDNKGGRWEKMAFTLYSDICDLRQIANLVLARIKGDSGK